MLPLAFLHSPTASYERLGYRIQQAISSPHVQKRQFVVLKPSADESTADWQRLLEDLEATTGVCIKKMDTGQIRITWRDFADT